MKTAADILNSKPRKDNHIAQQATLQQAAQHMYTINSTYLVVVEDGDLKGLFTEHDYLKLVAHQGKDPNTTQVKEAMGCHLPQVDDTADLHEVVSLMISHHTRYIPVFKGFEFQGVITMDNIIQGFLAPAMKADYDAFKMFFDYDRVMAG